MKLIKGAYFIESENVKVFPCSYRGFNDDRNIFDPEASGFTEYNFANIYGKQTKLISWTDNLLKCIIDGYYFEIKNIHFCIDTGVILVYNMKLHGAYKVRRVEPDMV